MLYRNEDGRHPSILVEDGETMTLSVKDAHQIGLPVVEMKPRTTAALLALAGRPQAKPPRLSNSEAFEHVRSKEGLVNLTEADQDGKISGYSVSHIRGVLDAFDPNDPVPPTSVKIQVPIKKAQDDCGCSGKRSTMEITRKAQIRGAIAQRDLSDVSLMPKEMYHVQQTFVPDFISKLGVYSLFTMFGDIVVGHNATLILENDIIFAIADNILAYRGSRIVQRSGYLNMDVKGVVRGGLLINIHTAATVLKIQWDELVRLEPTKP